MEIEINTELFLKPAYLESTWISDRFSKIIILNEDIPKLIAALQQIMKDNENEQA